MRSLVRVTSLSLAAACLLAPSMSLAMTHANSIKMPLVQYYAECGTDDSTTNCGLGNTGSATTNRAGEWEFTQGTIEIADNGKVSLRIDDIRPREIDACPGGLSGLCRCAITQGACGTPGNTCTGGVCMAAAGTEVVVEIFGQNFRDNNVLAQSPCNNQTCIGRDMFNDCHETFTFTVDNNGDIDANTGTGAFACDGYLALDGGEFRELQVRIIPKLGPAPENTVYSEEQQLAVPGFAEN